MTLRVLKGNKATRKWQTSHPGDITVTLTNATKFHGPAGLVSGAQDFRIGDGAKVQAARAADGSSLVARKIHLRLQSYEGSIASFDGAAVTVGVQWDKANKLAQERLANHGSPNPVTAQLTAATKTEREGGGDPLTGDHAELRARPTSDGSGLEAVSLETSAAP